MNYIGNVPVDPSKIPEDSVLSKFPVLSEQPPVLYSSQQYVAEQRLPQHQAQQPSPQIMQQVSSNPFFPPSLMMDPTYIPTAQQSWIYEDLNYPLACSMPGQRPPSGNMMSTQQSPSYGVGNSLSEAHSLSSTSPMAMQSHRNPMSNSSNPGHMFFPVSGTTFSAPQPIHSQPQRHATPQSPNYAKHPSRPQGGAAGQNAYMHGSHESRQSQNASARMSQAMNMYYNSQTSSSVNAQNSVACSQRAINTTGYENISPPNSTYPSSHIYNQPTSNSNGKTTSVEMAHRRNSLTNTNLPPNNNNFNEGKSSHHQSNINTHISQSQPYITSTISSSHASIPSSAFDMDQHFSLGNLKQKQSVKHSGAGPFSASPNTQTQIPAKSAKKFVNHTTATKPTQEIHYPPQSLASSEMFSNSSMSNRGQIRNDNLMMGPTDYSTYGAVKKSKAPKDTPVGLTALQHQYNQLRYSSPRPPVPQRQGNAQSSPPSVNMQSGVRNRGTALPRFPTSTISSLSDSNMMSLSRAAPPHIVSTMRLPPPRMAPPNRGAPPARKPGAVRGSHSVRGSFPARGGLPSKNVPSSTGALVSRSSYVRGGRSRGRGGVSAGGVRVDRNITDNNENVSDMHSASNNQSIVNPIQWYRHPDVAQAQSYYQSDIEAMRAPMASDQPPSDTYTVHYNGPNQGQVPRQSSNQSYSATDKETVKTVQEYQSSKEASRIRVKQEMAEIASVKKNVSISGGESLDKQSTPNDTSHLDQRPLVDRFQNMGDSSNDPRLSATSSSVHKESGDSERENSKGNCVSKSGTSLQTNSTSDSNQNAKTNNDLAHGSQSKESTLEEPIMPDETIDRKPVLSARDRVYSLWRAGQVVGRVPGRGRLKPKPQGVSSEGQEKEHAASKVVTGQGNKKQPDTENNVMNDKPKNDNNLFYVLFHGHKLLCFASGHGNSVLICQFQFECFPDKGKGNVSNCINKALRIKKKGLEHSSIKDIRMFLRKHGYLDNSWQDEPLYVISLDDARRVYHYVYNISECSLATCVVEVVNQVVDLNVIISPSKRKILTQEMKIRIKREKKQADDERYGKLQSQTKSNSGNSGTAPTSSNSKTDKDKTKLSDCASERSESNSSDHTMLYGDDDTGDVVIIEGPESPYLLKWDSKATQTGGVCNTIVGPVRFYRHEKDNYLVVSDLCRILGTTEFMTGVETDNVILYACSKDILSFLNEINDDFPKLDTGLNCLVKEKDIGVHSSETESENVSPGDSVSLAPLKRPLCKQEIMEDDAECSNSKRPCRFDVEVNNAQSVKEKEKSNDQINETIQEHAAESSLPPPDNHQTKTAPCGADHTKAPVEDESNIIICFDSQTVNAYQDKLDVTNETPDLNLDKKDATKDQNDSNNTVIPSPDSCVSTQSHDHPMSPALLSQQSDVSSPMDKTRPTNLCASTISPSPSTLSVDNSGSGNSKRPTENVSCAIPPQAKSSDVLEIESAISKTSVASSSNPGKGKMIVATVIDKSSVATMNMRKTINRIVGNNTAVNQSGSIENQPVLLTKNKVDQPCSDGSVMQIQKDVRRPSLSSQNPPPLRQKYSEDDMELSKLHITTIEGLEEYKSRGSLLKEMAILRTKNRTLQETLKCLRDQLKKSKAENDKSGKLMAYYEGVIQDITASFKDGDKVEEELPHQSSSSEPIVIDD